VPQTVQVPETLRGLVVRPTTAQTATEKTQRDEWSCPSCGQPIFTGDSTEKSGSGKTHHTSCLASVRASAPAPGSSKKKAAKRAVAKRAEQEALSDAAAQDNMRSQKPSTWRLGKSPADYGRRSY
jgi:ribosomal protein L37AE/L43A